MQTAEIRQRFLDYFAARGHTVVDSSPLVPHADPTLLFTNAGMVQFKNTFLGKEHRDYVRAVSSQKCVRAGGKHNDLENVGHTARHHTFFEMLGNFSFGDYFKHEAIAYAWEFLTQDLKLDPTKLFVTVFEEDDEAYDIWHNEVGVSADKIARIGAKDNFWAMGDVGPCGPCSEIFFDHGASIPGGPPGSPDEDGDRFIEIWNLVFMQYNRAADGTLTPLPNPSVDTGMGLERTAAVLQGVHNNYDIDLFRNIIAAASRITGVEIDTNTANTASLRVIADHLRSVVFLLADGVLPSNEGRGFVLRRILRRACRHGRLLGMEEAFIYQLVPSLVKVMGDHFHELTEQEQTISHMIRIEEERFIRTLDKGLKLVEEAVAQVGDGGTIAGETLFTLYDTYGFPLDLTADILRDRNITLDHAGFTACMEQQRQRARAAWGGSGASAIPDAIFQLREAHGATEFLGYQTLKAEGVVLGMITDNHAVASLNRGDDGWLISNQTPFYGESGGQAGDTGTIQCDHGKFLVTATKKILPDLFVHIGKIEQGTIACGDVVMQQVNSQRRAAVRRNHTATHLLQMVLRRVLGDHVKQAGSQVDDQRIRFDFNHFSPVTAKELAAIEQQLFDAIITNQPVTTQIMNQDEAVASGAMALFGEKYGNEVRVVTAGDSVELCGGTHVDQTGDIAACRILSESGIAAGVRRIEAVTGYAAFSASQQDHHRLQQLAQQLKTQPDQTVEQLAQLQQRLKETEKSLESARAKSATGMLDQLIAQAREINGVKLLACEVPADIANLRDFMDKAKGKLKSGVIAFGSKHGAKVQLIVGVTPDLTARYHAGNLVRTLAESCGGKGGGKPDMAMAGGTKPEQLTKALDQFATLL
ncbi:MAG: alanine--tRNA ligase [Mariprofundales bacterium]|nr:alanine--tRNA ligase [Mariprofundales bacterium]